MSDNGTTQSAENDAALFYAFKERSSDDGLYQVTCNGLPVPEETVAYYASIFPETVYFVATDTFVIPSERTVGDR